MKSSELKDAAKELEKHLPDGHEYKIDECKYTSEEDFSAVFRIAAITDGDSAKSWIRLFGDHNLTSWKTMRTYKPQGRVNIFKVDMRCQHNTDKRAGSKRMSKNTDCQAKLQVKIRRHTENTKSKRKDRHQTREWPCVISISNVHNHPIRSAAVLRFRAMSDETKSRLLDFFRRGCSPQMALQNLRTELALRHPDDFHVYDADGYHVPTLSVCAHLFNAHFRQQYGARSGRTLYADLQCFLEKYTENTTDGVAVCGMVDNRIYTAACSPIMRRTHRLVRQSSELIHVGSLHGVDRHDNRVYALVTATPAGGLPLGFITTETDDVRLFEAALTDLNTKCFPSSTETTAASDGDARETNAGDTADGADGCSSAASTGAFFGRGHPKVIMTDVHFPAKDALHRVFPDSVLLLCQSSLLETTSRWLSGEEKETAGAGIVAKGVVGETADVAVGGCVGGVIGGVRVSADDRQPIQAALRTLMSSETEQALFACANELQAKPQTKKYPEFVEYLKSLWETRHAWASCYRRGFPIRGADANSALSSVFRLLRDDILEETAAFNVTQLIDIILTQFESRIEKQLISFSHDRQHDRAMLKHAMPVRSTIAPALITPHGQTGGCYAVPSETTPNLTYIVDIESGLCGCAMGNTGRMCKHMTAAIKKYRLDAVHYSAHDGSHLKRTMFRVATGSEPNETWFMPLVKRNRTGDGGAELAADTTVDGISHSQQETVINSAAASVDQSETPAAINERITSMECASAGLLLSDDAGDDIKSECDSSLSDDDNGRSWFDQVVEGFSSCLGDDTERPPLPPMLRHRRYKRRRSHTGDAVVKSQNNRSTRRLVNAVESLFLNRIRIGLKTRPELFTPVVRTFVRRLSRSQTADDDYKFVDALKAFGNVISGGETVSETIDASLVISKLSGGDRSQTVALSPTAAGAASGDRALKTDRRQPPPLPPSSSSNAAVQLRRTKFALFSDARKASRRTAVQSCVVSREKPNRRRSPAKSKS